MLQVFIRSASWVPTTYVFVVIEDSLEEQYSASCLQLWFKWMHNHWAITVVYLSCSIHKEWHLVLIAQWGAGYIELLSVHRMEGASLIQNQVSQTVALKYCIYPKYWDTLTPYHNWPKNCTKFILLFVKVSISRWMCGKQCILWLDATSWPESRLFPQAS